MVLACHLQLRVRAGNHSVLSSIRVVCASNTQQLLAQRKKLKDVGFSDAQADTILIVAEGPVTESDGPLTAKKSELAYFRTENRLLFLLVFLIICCGAPTGTPVGDLVQGVFGPVVDSEVAVEGMDLKDL